MPTSLIQEDVPLPENYQPCGWAGEVVREWRLREKLFSIGAYPTISILLSGPSGVGKTTAARWIAQQLRLPVYSLLLSTTINSYMGETGKSIGQAVRFGMSVPCVLALDEIDAFASDRGRNSEDIKESWRITNTFIQILDQWHSGSSLLSGRTSLLIGTTNLVDSIDGAIRRRFEMEQALPMPTTAELSAIAGMEIPDWCAMTQAEMRRAVLRAKRLSVLDDVEYESALRGILEIEKGVADGQAQDI